MRTIELTSSVREPLSDDAVARGAADFLGRGDIRCRVVKRSIDARKSPIYRYSVEVCLPGEEFEEYRLPELLDCSSAPAVAVVGSGPAGMFAALKLLSLGLRPIVFERGKDVHARKVDMALLSRTGLVNADSNYCFGEGGAGTFSDGKLYTRSSKRGDNREVLYRLVECGASPSILYDAHPHIGSDRLPAVVENIRKSIIAHGGEYHFDTRIASISTSEHSATLISADGREFTASAVILATGHSARDVYEMLHADGGALQAKGFALGVRVEHPQQLINESQFRGAWRPGMPAAEYNFVRQEAGRGVFSFCMCPGGILVPSSTEPETVVLNGMSNSTRNSRWANAGVVVQVEPEDIPGDGPFKLLDFQLEVERNMYRYTKGLVDNPMAAPAQRMTDFCKGRMSPDLPDSSYHPGTVTLPLHKMLPAHVSRRLAAAFPKVPIRGYYTSEALLLGVESRTSSPVRIPRDPISLQYVSNPLIFPAGEGAGYSGGIVSSAIDGIRAASAAASILK